MPHLLVSIRLRSGSILRRRFQYSSGWFHWSVSILLNGISMPYLSVSISLGSASMYLHLVSISIQSWSAFSIAYRSVSILIDNPILPIHRVSVLPAFFNPLDVSFNGPFQSFSMEFSMAYLSVSIPLVSVSPFFWPISMINFIYSTRSSLAYLPVSIQLLPTSIVWLWFQCVSGRFQCLVSILDKISMAYLSISTYLHVVSIPPACPSWSLSSVSILCGTILHDFPVHFNPSGISFSVYLFGVDSQFQFFSAEFLMAHLSGLISPASVSMFFWPV